MYTNHFNRCRSCVYDEYCSLTIQKYTVWECSDHSELLADITTPAIIFKEQKEPEMAIA